MSPMLSDLQISIQRLRDNKPLWFTTADPASILLLTAYNTGAQHATSQIASGSSPDWHINDIFADCTDMLAYIRVEQLKIQRSMGGDTSKFNVLDRRSRAGFDGPGTPDA